MNFKFLNYNENIFEYIVSQKSYSFGNLFICENINNKNILIEKLIGKDNNQVLTKEEFLTIIKEGINDDNIRLLLFFLSLSKENKVKFRINDIFDCKDLFSRFKSFYKELMEADIEKPKGLLEWQEKIYSEMEEIRINYLKFLEKNSIKDHIFNKDLDITFFKQFQKIVFVNVLYYSNLDKKILKSIGENIEIILQLPENNFNKENLNLIRVDLPDKFPNIEIFKTNDDFLQSINILKDLNKGRKILDLRGESFLHSVNNFAKFDEIFSSTLTFNLLENILKLLKGVRKINETFTIKTSTLLNVINSPIIKEAFQIHEDELKNFDFFIQEGYKYIYKQGLFLNLFNFIEKLYNIDKFEQFYEIFHNFEIVEDKEIFHETLNFLKNIGDKFLKNNWNKIFHKNFPRKLLAFLIGIISEKTIKKEAKYLIEKLGEEAYENSKEIVLMNLSDSFIKYEELEKNILTDSQKSNNDIKDYASYSLEHRYKILRNIFSSENVKIYYIKDKEKNIDSYPLIEEIKLKFNIEEKDTLINEKHYNQIFDVILNNREILKIGRDEKDPLPFNKEDLIKKNEYALSFYDFSEFEKCQYKYYLKFIASLGIDNYEIKYRIDPYLVGEIAHKLLSRVAVLMDNNLRLGIYELKGINIGKILNEIVKGEKYKIPITYYNFYKKILFPSIINSVNTFYTKIKEELKEKDIKEIFVEKLAKYEIFNLEDEKSFFLKGKADLIIETNDQNYIIDYKTGKGESKQLDFYKIIYYNLSSNVNKMFYKIFEEELKLEGREILKEKDIKEKISTFFKGTIYSRTDKKSYCRTCEYFNICHSVGE